MEQKLAYVHTNKEKSLKVISNLIKQVFPIRSNWSCLYNQFLFTYESLTGLPLETLFCYKFRDKHGTKGHTPQELINFANKRSRRFVFAAECVANIDSAISDIETGQPVVLVISNENPLWKETSNLDRDLAKTPKNREIGECKTFGGNIIEPPTIGYHALLLVGYDNKYDFVIGRESTHYGGFKGYFKIKKSLLAKHPESAAYLKFTIHEK